VVLSDSRSTNIALRAHYQHGKDDADTLSYYAPQGIPAPAASWSKNRKIQRKFSRAGRNAGNPERRLGEAFHLPHGEATFPMPLDGAFRSSRAGPLDAHSPGGYPLDRRVEGASWSAGRIESTSVGFALAKASFRLVSADPKRDSERRPPVAAHLPERPSIRHLQEQAKDLLKSHRHGEAAACAILRAHPRFRNCPAQTILAARLSLQQVQHALARHYGFRSWSDMKARVRQRPAADVTGELHEKGNKGAELIAALATRDNAVLAEVFQAVKSSDKRTKNAAAKVLQLISREMPGRLYPRLAFFAELLEGDDNILKWIATDVIGNLAGVDAENRVDDRLVATFLRLLSDNVMITAAHAVDNLGRIALSKPQHRERITGALLRPDAVERQAECHNILAGRKIDAFARYCHLLDDLEPILDFVRRHLRNSRNATRNRAARFLKKFDRSQPPSS